MKRNIMLRKLLLLALCLLLLGLCIPGGAEEDPSNAGWTYDEQTKATIFPFAERSIPRTS